MPQDSNKAKATQPKGFTSQSPASQPPTDVPTDVPTEASIGGQAVSAQMLLLIQADQAALQVMGKQLEEYGDQRTNAVVRLFQNVITESNAAIEDGIRGVSRGLCPNFLEETGVFFGQFGLLKSAKVQMTLSSAPIETEVM